MKLKCFYLVISLCFLAAVGYSQCVIYCKDDNTKPNKVKPVGFKLILEPVKGFQPVLISTDAGSIWINKKDFTKLKERRVIRFEFLNPLDHEKYGTPALFKQRVVRLKDLCSKTLIVNFLW